MGLFYHAIFHKYLLHIDKNWRANCRQTSALFVMTAAGIFKKKVGLEYVCVFINFLLYACKFSDFPGGCWWRHILPDYYTVYDHKRVPTFRKKHCLHFQDEWIKFRLM
jgi:hypothetical protein